MASSRRVWGVEGDAAAFHTPRNFLAFDFENHKLSLFFLISYSRIVSRQVMKANQAL